MLLNDDYLTVQELAEKLRLAPSTLYTWRSNRIGPPATRVGGRVIYRVADVDAWLAAQQQSAAS